MEVVGKGTHAEHGVLVCQDWVGARREGDMDYHKGMRNLKVREGVSMKFCPHLNFP